MTYRMLSPSCDHIPTATTFFVISVMPMYTFITFMIYSDYHLYTKGTKDGHCTELVWYNDPAFIGDCHEYDWIDFRCRRVAKIRASIAAFAKRFPGLILHAIASKVSKVNDARISSLKQKQVKNEFDFYIFTVFKMIHKNHNCLYSKIIFVKPNICN